MTRAHRLKWLITTPYSERSGCDPAGTADEEVVGHIDSLIAALQRYKEEILGKSATPAEPDDRCGNYNRVGCSCALLKHPRDCPTGGRGPCKDYKWGRS